MRGGRGCPVRAGLGGALRLSRRQRDRVPIGLLRDDLCPTFFAASHSYLLVVPWLFDDKSIAAAPHRQQVPGIVRIVFQFRAQLGHEIVDGARLSGML